MEGGHNIQQRETNSSNSGREDIVENNGYMYSCCHPNGTLHRFIALFFMCLMGFGSYFCYDNPAALQDNFMNDLNLTTTQFALFYSLYSWPNVVLCFVGGFLMDRVFGVRLGTNIYMTITLIGQFFFAAGGYFDYFWVMILGRFIFGIGAESLAVAQNNYAVLWFKGKELNMVFGLQLSFARVGSTVNFWVMEPIYSWVGSSYSGPRCIGVVLFIAAITCIASMVCSLILGCLDKRAERILRRNDNSNAEIVRVTDVKDFHASFWLLSMVCVSYYVAIFPFIALGKVFFMKKFNMTAQAANSVNSVVYLISAFASPLLGLLVDKTGKNVFWVLFAIAVTTGAHSLLAFTMLNPYIGMSIMGMAYSMLASGLWPLVSLVIPEYQLGTAYGICQAVQNFGLALISLLAGIIVDKWGYTWLEIFFISGLCVSFIVTFIIWIIDYAGKGTLNMTPSQRAKHERSVIAAEILEKEKLISAGVSSESSSGNHLQPSSDFHIRNRYLSRIGAPLPSNYNINMKGLAFRALR